MKTKITFIVLLFTAVVVGQNQNEGEIVISKAHLISLLQKFKQQDDIKLNKEEVTKELMFTNKTVKSDSLTQRVRVLENQIAVLKAKIDAGGKDTVVVSSSKTIVIRDTLYRTVVDSNGYQKSTAVREDDKNYENQLNTLNRKYETLLRNQEVLLARQKQNIVVVNPVVALNEETKPAESITAVTTFDPVSSLVVVKDSLPSNSTELKIKPEVKSVVVPDVVKTILSEVHTQVFFDNNSAQINSGDTVRLQQLVEVLNENESLSVFLEGYTSKKGNSDYNNKLSLLRNDSVKQFLIERGVSVKRIFSQHHGVDSKSLNEAAARRVDVSIDVKD
ncbi:Outer membrane protein OmpA [Flavobacterium gillisiae]|uniref:Outer membrane protein OmpA n=1 Tax=Flavobacterium gillisiae TaxID=150146 RepID=A0A1H3X503_9FLAO|nr:OmpA family protein [Flavobacterium gillisiae]SDZ94466.1 Outer membrane protein OmpA [Flavobacterium gillisiae]